MDEIKVYGPFISRTQAQEQGLTHYFTGKPCKYGHIPVRTVKYKKCPICAINIETKSLLKNPNRQKNWRIKNREKYREINRVRANEWRSKNPEKAKEYSLKNVKTWQKKNPEIYALLNRNKSRLNDLIKKGLLDKGGGHSRSIGCNAHQFKDHIESQFVNGMSWDNFDQIEIDHIRPISSFYDLLNNQEQRKVCFNYRNIQPLWIKDNRDKRDDYTPLDELAWVERMQALGYEGELFLKYEEGNSY